MNHEDALREFLEQRELTVRELVGKGDLGGAILHLMEALNDVDQRLGRAALAANELAA